LVFSKGDEIMEAYKIDDLVGIYEEDGSVKCRDCMKEEDWRELKEENIITMGDVERSDDWFFCDYCEKRL
jgi:hypothetical protein